jgi:uncharacterized lipoprotein YmbA
MLATLSGCVGQSQSARFYVLNSMKEAPMAGNVPTAHSDLVLGIGPITIADYLNRQDIVTRDSSNKLKMNEFEQWAGSFDDNLIHALADNVGFLSGTDQIHIYPWRKSMPIDYQIAINVIRFDGQLGGQARLTARWRVVNLKTGQMAAVKRSSIQEPVEGNSYEDLVAAQSRALATLSREMAAVIKTAP